MALRYLIRCWNKQKNNKSLALYNSWTVSQQKSFPVNVQENYKLACHILKEIRDRWKVTFRGKERKKVKFIIDVLHPAMIQNEPCSIIKIDGKTWDQIH